MSQPPMPPGVPQDGRSFPWFAVLLLLLGSTGVAAAWVAVSMVTGSQCAWMSLVAGLDAAWLLRLAGAPRGGLRMAAGVCAAAAAIALAHWGIVSAHLAGMMGMGFVETAMRLGPSLAWTLSALANTTTDLAMLFLGLVVAAFASR
ncbi:hypothetical protein LVB87_07475 [Lysobacter sp. KIS68-7]|uniref:hypothetical protein n=1 Tax=Lysobacter sp. KIS68-7 TaxID=2904252 RepID=UPI001E4D46FA|nr:hypothetical protein [Lysobacter sp. KIS68-7]UHQ20964.1 hypothetical protein LVB87_07475 [Lysobacter sp. KIS68-7]